MFTWKRTILSLILIANLLSLGFAQGSDPQQNNNTATSSNVDQSTPNGAAKGVNPLGSYGGSNFDKVNLFNGNMSMSFPLASLTSRGGMSAGVVLTYNSKLWRVEKLETAVGGAQSGTNSISYQAVYDEYDRSLGQLAAGWTIQAGTMRGRQSALYDKNNFTCVFAGSGIQKPKPIKTLTTFAFTSPDGTEYEFRDVIYDGEPRGLINCEPVNRGKKFEAKDGTSATFVTDNDVIDSFFTDQIIAPNGPNGFVYLRDGSRFRIENGRVIQQRDHNGNIVRYDYDGSYRLTQVTDNMGRIIIVNYNIGGGALATITIKGIGGVDRVTTVRGSRLVNNLVSGQSSLTIDQLFPVEAIQASMPNSSFNPRVVSEITLPDGHKWEFKYNSYGEVLRAKTPARGAVEFEMGPSPGSAQKGGYIENLNEIFRRVVNRRTFPFESSLPEGKTTYSDPRNPSLIDVNQDLTVEEREVDPSSGDSVLAATNHKFSGHPTNNIKGTGVPLNSGYKAWLEGKELVTEWMNFNASTVMRRSVTDYEQEAGVGWVAGSSSTFLAQPENNPRVVRATTRLLDGSTTKTSKVEYQYGEFNNVTNEKVFDYSTQPNTFGPLLRETNRTYVKNLNNIDYTGLNSQINPDLDTHLRSLIESQTIKNLAGNTETTTKYEYDNYSGANHATLIERTLSVNTHSEIYQNPTRIQRGNLTAITAGFGTPQETTVYSQYDVLGNVVAVVGPIINQKTEIIYNVGSQFTFPESTKQYVNGGLSGSRVLTSNRTFDFYTGAVLSSSGFNTDTTTFQYNDLLDRLTLEIRPDDTNPGGFGRTQYSYSAPGVYPNTVTVESSLDSGRKLKSISEFDGFLRTTIQRRTDPDNAEVVSQTFYDALGRVNKVTNPSRTTVESDPTYGYTTSQYDALSRVLMIKTFANDATNTSTGTVTSEYDTNLVIVTDQAGKKRKSEADALGRLIKVYEPSSPSNELDQITSYDYDSRSNLKVVHQGDQTRQFNYDSLSRLTDASSPESGMQGNNTPNGVTFYKYDVASNLIERKDPRNIISTYSYDSLNRLATKSYSDSTPPVSYFYDIAPNSLPTGVTAPNNFSFQHTLGRTTAIASPNTTREFATALFHTYDKGGRITKSSQLLDGEHYTTSSDYNLASLPTNHTYPSGRTIDHTYNIAGQITDVMSNSQPISEQATYTASGSIKSHKLGNGLYHQIQYNSRLQPASISLGSGSLGSFDVFKLEYDYGFYSVASLSNANAPSLSALDPSKNNGNIGIIRIFPGTPSNGGGGDEQLNNNSKSIVGVDNEESTPPFIEQAFAYDELNRLKLAKEFAPPFTPQICPTVGSGGTTVEPGTSSTFIVTGSNLDKIQQVNVPASSNLSVSIVSTSPEVLTLFVDAPPSSTGSHSIELVSDCGSSVIGVNVVCLYTNKLNQTDDMVVSDSIGAFSLELTNSTTTTPKANATGIATVEVDLTTAHFDPSITPNPFIRLRYDVRVENVDATTAFVTILAKANNNVISGISESVFAQGDSSSNPYSNSQLGTVDFNLTPYIGSVVVFSYEVNVTCTANNTVFPFVQFTSQNFSLCNIILPQAEPIARKTKSITKKTKSITEPSPLVDYTTSWTQAYSYDRYGNRTQVEGTNEQLLEISTFKNRITSPGYVYDKAGNLIADPNGKFFFYDAENKLVTVSSDEAGTNVISQYFYDGNGWRVKKVASTTTRFVYDQGGRLLSEYDGEPVAAINAPTKENIYGPTGMLATVEPDKTNYHTPDHLGSPRVLTDASGSVISRRDFLPWGEQLADSFGNRANIQGYSLTDSIHHKFTGYERDDETNLDFAGARYLSNSFGRFMSLDPSRTSVNPLRPQTWNRYIYVLNNPLRYIDPTGLAPQDPPNDEDPVFLFASGFGLKIGIDLLEAYFAPKTGEYEALKAKQKQQQEEAEYGEYGAIIYKSITRDYQIPEMGPPTEIQFGDQMMMTGLFVGSLRMFASITDDIGAAGGGGGGGSRAFDLTTRSFPGTAKQAKPIMDIIEADGRAGIQRTLTDVEKSVLEDNVRDIINGTLQSELKNPGKYVKSLQKQVNNGRFSYANQIPGAKKALQDALKPVPGVNLPDVLK